MNDESEKPVGQLLVNRSKVYELLYRMNSVLSASEQEGRSVTIHNQKW